MHTTIFQMIEQLLELSAFELEYQHRAKANPFSEKWLNSTRIRARTEKLKKFLYNHIKVIFESDFAESYYVTALKPYLRLSFMDLYQDIRAAAQLKEMDILYRTIFYRLSLDELFILLTNTISWEHLHYPALLENELIRICRDKNQEVSALNDDILKYYVRFLDVLSSQEIVSLFDLDALKNTIDTDIKLIGKEPLKSLHLFSDWPVVNREPFCDRFPQFKTNVSKKLVTSMQFQMNQ
jgi:hypothetical protein